MLIFDQDGAEYIKARVDIQENGCWLWTKSLGSHGYGNAYWPVPRVTVAHRVSYECFKGPIPEGMHIDHLCMNRQCVNPEHLEAVTQAENNRRAWAGRKDVLLTGPCKHGHPAESRYRDSNGKPVCKECKKKYNRNA